MKTKAFTLIELITVVAIIGIVAAIIIPTVNAVRGKTAAKQTTYQRPPEAAQFTPTSGNKEVVIDGKRYLLVEVK